MRAKPLVVVTVASVLGACAVRGTLHTAADESKPHISWEIQQGIAADERFVCGTRRPEAKCVLAASREQRRTRAIVQVHLHAAKIATRYLGVIEVPFIKGATNRGIGEVSVDVRAGSNPVGTTVVGQIDVRPGDFDLAITLDAVQEGQSVSRIVERIPVTIQ